jgi:hypothetical protein
MILREREDMGGGGNLHNEELYDSFSSLDIFKMIKSRCDVGDT